jgi:hypothetical protein
MKSLLKILFLIAVLIMPGALHGQQFIYYSSSLMGRMADIEISGDYGYCAMPSGLEIIYLGDSIPTLIYDLYLSGCGLGIDIRGNYVYLADGPAGLQIIDISNPSNPILTGTYNTRGNTADVKVLDDNIAYVADGDGIACIDISNPVNPVLAGSYFYPQNSRRIVVNNHLAYLACADNHLHIFDVSSSHWPEEICGLPLPGRSLDLSISDTLLFVADDNGGAHIINVNDARHPAIIAEIACQNATALAAKDSLLFLADFNHVDIINISNPVQIRPLSQLEIPFPAQRILLNGNYAYIVICDYGLLKADMSNPENPRLVGSMKTGSAIKDLQIRDNYAYVADGEFKIIDISNRAFPLIVGNMILPELEIESGFAVSGNYAFISFIGNNIYYFGIVDIENKNAPFLTGACATPGYVGKIAVQGNYAYVTDYSTGVLVIDISNPLIPRIVATHRPNGNVTDIQVQGNYAYILVQHHNLQIVDIFNPLNPHTIGDFFTDTIYLLKLHISGRYAYLLDLIWRMTIVDVSDPTRPTLASNFYVPGETYFDDIELYGNYALLSGHYLERTDGDLFAINISNPDSPFIATTYPLADFGNAISCSDEFIYIGSNSSLLILYFEQTGISEENPAQPNSFTLNQNYPNPFNGMTTIKYSLAEASFVSIDIYDLLGRKMGSVFSGFKDAGSHSAIWNSRDTPSGAYFYQINTGKRTLRNKMMLLK